MSKPNSTPSELDRILAKIRWGDFQREDGTWGTGVANKPETKAQLIQLIEGVIDAGKVNDSGVFDRQRAALKDLAGEK